jgi:diamine N-acetyltransferase
LRPIGFTYLSDIAEQKAEFGIVIGERACQGKGYGTEATRLMLDYAFNILNLHNVMLKVAAYNEAGIRAYEKAGFQVIGRRREVKMINGKRWDMIYMDCLATEFESPVMRLLFGE